MAVKFDDEVMREKGSRGAPVGVRSGAMYRWRIIALQEGVTWHCLWCVSFKMQMRDVNSEAGSELCEGCVCGFEVYVE